MRAGTVFASNDRLLAIGFNLLAAVFVLVALVPFDVSVVVDISFDSVVRSPPV